MDPTLPLTQHKPIEALNRDCLCLSLDESALTRALDSELGQPGLSTMVRERCPFLFSAQPVFVAASQLLRMAEVIRAVESVVALPSYREEVLATAPAVAQLAAQGPGVFFGYDFHLSQGQLGLIEINTTAGGAMLNAVLARAQRAACAAVDPMVPTLESIQTFEQRIVEMFRCEWRASGNSRPLASIAIVDAAPEDQHLYPEFLLFQQLFVKHGIQSVIADPTALEWRSGKLWHQDLAVDLVYNRLTDFYLEQPEHAALRDAYLHRGVVLTPHPQAHALYADKRRLALFSDPARLQALGVPAEMQAMLLEHVPRTELVDAANAQRLWDSRRGLFFKPQAGFGSKAAYRGDKLTRRVWQEILASNYVAQAIVTPGERMVNHSDGNAGDDAENTSKALKFDLRAYAYDGAVQWFAARLYQGQTTNFRTPGGGFAPVYSTVDASGRSLHMGTGSGDGGSEAGTAYASYVFLLDDDGGIHPLPHALYVALARGQASAPALAGRTLRLADWYVRLENGEPNSVANETYSLVRFDPEGRADWAGSPVTLSAHAHDSDVATVPEDAGWPTVAERERMRELLFGAAKSVDTQPSSDSSTPAPPVSSTKSLAPGKPSCR